MQPRCVIVTGRPGSGKTTLARTLGERLCMPVISRDAIKEGYVNTRGVGHAALPPDTNAVVSKLFFELVNEYLAGGVSIVIEAAFQHEAWRPRMSAILALSSPLVIVCAVAGEVADRRHLQRGLNNPDREYYHGDARVAAFRATGVILPPDDYATPELDAPTLQVSTDAGYSPGLDDMVKWIRAS